jgi:hypothetical protein
MKAHPAVLGDASGRLGGVPVAVRLDAVALAPPASARAGAHGDARTQRRCRQGGEQRLVTGEGIVVALGSRCDESRDAARRPGQHAPHLVRARRGEGKETRRVVLVAGIDAIEREGVEVEVQVQGRAEALNEGDGAALAPRRAPPDPCSPAQRSEERPEKGAQHLAGERSVVGAAVAERMGQRENPLADGHFR